MSHKIANPKKIHAKADKHRVIYIHNQCGNFDIFQVVSSSSGNDYLVRVYDGISDQVGAECGCKWGYYRGRMDKRSACSHAQAVFDAIEESKARRTSAWGSLEDAFRQHRPTLDIGDGVILTSRKA